MLEAEIRTHDCAGRDQPVVEGRATHRTRGGQLLVWVREPEAARVILRHFRSRVLRGGEGAEASHIHGENVLSWVLLGHPAREHEPYAAPLAEARHDRARHPVVAHA